MGVLLNILVLAGGWLHGTWRSELVLTDRLVDTVAKSNERDKVAGLPECGDLTAADGAGKLCSVAHDDGFDGCLCEVLLVSELEGEVSVRSWSVWLFLKFKHIVMHRRKERTLSRT